MAISISTQVSPLNQSAARKYRLFKAVLAVLLLVCLIAWAVTMSILFDKAYYDEQLSKFARTLPLPKWRAEGPSMVYGDLQATEEKIPKLIWTYWNDDPDNIPAFVDDCINGWRKRLPDYNITLVTRKTLESHLGSDTAIPHNFDTFVENESSAVAASQSDWIRLALLKEHGGIWMDASTILTTSNLNFIHEPQERHGTQDFYFYLSGVSEYLTLPHLESFVIGSVKNSVFIKESYSEFTRIIADHGFSDSYYRQFSRVEKMALTYSLADASYLKVYAAFRKVLAIDRANVSIYATPAEGNPYKITNVNYLFKSGYNTHSLPPLIKLGKGDRDRAIAKSKNNAAIHPDSIYARFVKNGGTE